MEQNAERVLDDSSGELLAELAREHEPTDSEVALATMATIAIAVTAQEGELHPLLLRWDADAALTRIASSYPTLTASSRGAPLVSATREGLISDPPRCSDNCRPELGELRDRVIEQLRDHIAAIDPAGDLTRLIDDLAGTGDATSSLDDETVAAALPPSARDLWLNSLARSSGIVALAARALGVAAGATVATQVLVVVSAIKGVRALRRLAPTAYDAVEAWRACKRFKALNCGPDGGGRDGGAPDGGADAGVDAGRDAGMDGGTDGGADGGADASLDGALDAGDMRVIDCVSGPCPSPYTCVRIGTGVYRCGLPQTPPPYCPAGAVWVESIDRYTGFRHEVCICAVGPLCTPMENARPLLVEAIPGGSADCAALCDD